ncbi:MAG: ABC transporter substrate-binding protein [Bacteroidales bacterium]
MLTSRAARAPLLVLLVSFAAILFLVVAACSRAASPGRVTLRVGYFPNITHSQAVIGVADGTFRRAFGDDVDVQPRVFNAGPSAIEALFAGQIDLAYIGPNPAINGFVRSNGRALRIVGGATSGGAVLVVRADSGIERAAQFEGKRIASPQLGNTQDVALRAWLQQQGLRPREQGGSTWVVPVANPDILTLFRKKEIDAAWVPEPWGARLVEEAGGRLFLDERALWPGGRFVTAHLIARTEFLDAQPGVVSRWLDAHVELTRRIAADPVTAKRLLNAEIERLTGKALPDRVLDDAWSRLEVTWDPVQSSLQRSADSAFRLGFLGDARPSLDGIYELRLLNEVLRRKKLAEVPVMRAEGGRP